MYRLLKCDPSAYAEVIVDLSFLLYISKTIIFIFQEYRPHFISVLLQSLVIRRLTMENEYISLLLSLDGLHYPLLHEIPVKKLPEKEDFHLTPGEYFEARVSIISRQCYIFLFFKLC